ncbi:MAG TPA: HDOD domain-containing protein [Deltaproteobacteria bacterium]|nr:HDOD domain-containing protein [Deltaproteobacteria bacterium]
MTEKPLLWEMEQACPLGLVERHIEGFPTLDASRMRIFRMLQDETAGHEEIERAVSCDPAISARVVKLANSPFYRHSDHHVGIAKAIRTIGLDMVKCIALSAAVIDAFRSQTEVMGMLWAHSYAVAVVAGSLGQTRNERDVLFTGGLLHDLGRMVLLSADAEGYPGLCKTSRLWPEPLQERERYGIDHCSAGGILAERWRFPPEVVQVIKAHHEPRERFSATIGLIDFIASAEEAGMDGGTPDYERFAPACAEHAYKELVNTVRNRYRSNSAVVDNLC